MSYQIQVIETTAINLDMKPFDRIVGRVQTGAEAVTLLHDQFGIKPQDFRLDVSPDTGRTTVYRGYSYRWELVGAAVESTPVATAAAPTAGKLTPAQARLIEAMRRDVAERGPRGYPVDGAASRAMASRMARAGLIRRDAYGRCWLIETMDALHAEALAVAANQDQSRAWALRHLNGQCDSRGTCQPVPASAERPANPDFFEWVGALWCDEREAHQMITHRWYQDKRINDRGPDAIACNCTQSDGKDHVFTPSCMWDDNPAVSISAGDYGQPVGPKCARHMNPDKRPADSHDVPGSGYVYPKTGPTCVKVWVSPNGVRHGIDEQGRCMTCGYRHDGQETITPEASAALIDDGHQGSSGTSVRELAHSWSMQIHELRAFADDLLDGLGDGDDIPTDTLATLTEARNTTPAPRFSGYAKRPLHTRISSTYYGQTRSRVHARFEAVTDAEDLMCGATGLPTDDVETTTDAVDCPLCLRLLESRETYATELGI